MNLTPGNRYIFSEADSTHVVDECILLELSPSKRFCKIQATHFTQWTKVDCIVFVEDLGKADPKSVRNPKWETTVGYMPLFDRPYEEIKVGPPPRQTATEIATNKIQQSKPATEVPVKQSEVTEFEITIDNGKSKFGYSFSGLKDPTIFEIAVACARTIGHDTRNIDARRLDS